MIYFVSDVHLGFHSDARNKKIENMLIAFLRKIANDCTDLYIVGDLFDYWFDYKTVIPGAFYRTLSELSTLKAKNINIEYLVGNHDFGHFRFFEKELGIPLYYNDITRTHSSKKFYISHGDGKLYNDKGYLILKKILRNRLANKLYRLLHPDCGITLALKISRHSRDYTDAKSFGKNDGLKDFAEKKIKEGFDYVIMGHIHQISDIKFAKGKYINLGTWLREPSFAMFDGKELQLRKVEEIV